MNGVCSTDLRLYTSKNGLKQVYTSPEAIYEKTYFLKKCEFKINLQLLEKKFLSQTNTTPKMAFYLAKWPISKNLQYVSN
jgi:hypothetical protein